MVEIIYRKIQNMTLKDRLKLIFLSFILLAAFVIFSFLVSKELLVNIDFDTTVRLQNKIPRSFDYPLSFLSLVATFELSLLYLLSIFILVAIKYKKFFFGLFTFFVILLLELMGKIFIFHPAPPYMFFRYVLGFSFPSSYIHTNYSYPSGHMSRTAFFIVIILFIVHKYIKNKFLRWSISLVFLGLGMSMLVSRIYLGEHWFSDVLGGILLGTSIASFSLVFW